jgi:hypothetical protein
MKERYLETNRLTELSMMGITAGSLFPGLDPAINSEVDFLAASFSLRARFVGLRCAG